MTERIEWKSPAGPQRRAFAVVLVLVMAAALLIAAPAARAATLPNRTTATAGASLPIAYDLGSLAGNEIFVSSSGSDTGGNGSQTAPYRTLPKAINRAASGDSIVVRGGTYPIAGNLAVITKRLTITAYPGETPVFDGSIAAPTTTSAEGNLRYFSYTPMPAKAGEGISLTTLPLAFSGSTPTALASARGWKCVTGSSTYTNPSGSGTGCPSGSTARVISGFFPDQAWLDGKQLVQVLNKSKVVPGTFYVERSSASDGSPGASRMYLSSQDAASMAKVRVSGSSGIFLMMATSGVKVQGLRVLRHSPAWPDSTIRVTFASNDATIANMELTDCASIAVKIMGGSKSDQSQITRRTTLDKVSITRAGWMATSATYTDDTSMLNVVLAATNPHNEYETAPKTGAMKGERNHGMKIIGSVVTDTNGNGLWWDQSNYDTLVANSKVINSSGSQVVYEISYGLTMVNNYFVHHGPSADTRPTVRIAGSSKTELVNNTIVGGPVPLAFATDGRAKVDSTGRPCSEHPARYGGSDNYSAACPPGTTSDLDMARPGAYGSKNLTPGMVWKPSAVMLVNNVIANPTTAQGQVCPGGYALCANGSVGNVSVPANYIFGAGLIMNGNVYQAPNAVAQIRVPAGAPGALSAESLAELKAAFSSSFFKLSIEQNGLDGGGWVGSNGAPTAALNAKQGQAAPVPTDPTINAFVPAGSRKYGTTLPIP